MRVCRHVVLRREDHRPEVGAGDPHALLGQAGAHRVHGAEAGQHEVHHRERLVDLCDARVGVERGGLGRWHRPVDLPRGGDARGRVEREEVVEDRRPGPALADNHDRWHDVDGGDLGMRGRQCAHAHDHVLERPEMGGRR